MTLLDSFISIFINQRGCERINQPRLGVFMGWMIMTRDLYSPVNETGEEEEEEKKNTFPPIRQ